MKIKNIQIIHFILLVSLLIYSNDNHLELFSLDGNTVIPFNLNSPYSIQSNFCAQNKRISTSYSIIKNLNTFLDYCNDENRPHIAVRTELGAETGEPLFARLTNGASYNREHLTYGAAMGSFFKKKFNIIGFYTHNGHYADKFENYAGQYHKIYKTAMKYADVGNYGLSNHMFFALNGQIGKLEIYDDISRLQNWECTPVLYTPLFCESYSSYNTLSIPLQNSTVFFSILNNKKTILSYNNTGIDYISCNVNLNLKHSFPQNIEGELLIKTSTDSSEHVQIATTLRDSSTESFQWELKNSINDLGKPSFGFYLKLKKLNIFSIKTHFKRKFHSSSNGYSFKTLSDTVTYAPLDYYETALHTQFKIEHSAFFSINTLLSTHFDLNPSLPGIDSNAQRTIASNYSIESPSFIITGETNIAIKRNFFSMDIQLLHNKLTAGIKPHLFYPWSGKFSLHLYPFGIEKLKFSADLKAFATVTCTRYNNATEMIYYEKSGKTIGLYFNTTLPFTLPLFSKHITPTIKVSAGPIFLRGENRQYFHPLSSPMGSMVSIKLDADLK